MNSFSSKFLEEAVAEFARLPGVGRKTAMRLVLHLLKQEPERLEQFSRSLMHLKDSIRYCGNCHNISESEVCNICNDRRRDNSLVCVVEDIRDVLSIENTGQYRGYYHVLGGIISPMDGIGPSDLNIDTLLQKVSSEEVKEVILALSTTIEGDTTLFYLYKKMKDLNVTISTISRGVAIGDALEYTDEITLGRSIINRTPYENMLVRHQ